MNADLLHRFSFADAPIRGQWIRLQGVLDALEERVSYPPGVARLLAEMLAAVAVVAEGIQFQGAVSLQSRGRGPLTTVLAECREQSLLRGIARWPDGAEPPGASGLADLLGDADLAITLTTQAPRPGDAPFSYQGLISATGNSLAASLERYFADSEQLPTRLCFAHGRDGARGSASVTGLMLQRLPAADDATEIALDAHDESWRAVLAAAEGIAPAMLASADPESLLRASFPGRTIALHTAKSLRFHCPCSRERSSSTLQALPRAELLEILEEQGMIDVTCEICGARYEYQPVDVHLLLDGGARTIH